MKKVLKKIFRLNEFLSKNKKLVISSLINILIFFSKWNIWHRKTNWRIKGKTKNSCIERYRRFRNKKTKEIFIDFIKLQLRKIWINLIIHISNKNLEKYYLA